MSSIYSRLVESTCLEVAANRLSVVEAKRQLQINVDIAVAIELEKHCRRFKLTSEDTKRDKKLDEQLWCELNAGNSHRKIRRTR